MNSLELARLARIECIKIVARAKASHLGGALSCMDILSVLYSSPFTGLTPVKMDDSKRDRLIFSKGHCCSALYCILALKGFFEKSELETYGQNDSRLMAHASHFVPGIEFSSGSLGMGPSFGCGLALSAKRKNEIWKTYVVLSDGELGEGSVWESLAFAAHHQLHTLCYIIDRNRLQGLGPTSEVLAMDPLGEKFSAFGWHVVTVDGHDHVALEKALLEFETNVYGPTVILANTVKGKGVSFMEGDNFWHYTSPNKEQLDLAMLELGASK